MKDVSEIIDAWYILRDSYVLYKYFILYIIFNNLLTVIIYEFFFYSRMDNSNSVIIRVVFNLFMSQAHLKWRQFSILKLAG